MIHVAKALTDSTNDFGDGNRRLLARDFAPGHRQWGRVFALVLSCTWVHVILQHAHCGFSMKELSITSSHAAMHEREPSSGNPIVGPSCRFWPGLANGSGLSPPCEDIGCRRNERLLARPSLAALSSKASDKPSRNQCIHQAMRVYEYTPEDIAAFTGLHCLTISVIAKRVDQGRHQE